MTKILDFTGEKVKKEQAKQNENIDIEIYGSGVYENSSAQTLIVNLLADIHKYLNSYTEGKGDLPERKVGNTEIDDNFKINVVVDLILTYPFAFNDIHLNTAFALLDLTIKDLKNYIEEHDTMQWILLDTYQENFIKLSRLIKQRMVIQERNKKQKDT